MTLEPPHRGAGRPRRVVAAINQLAEDQRASARKQMLVNLGLLLLAVLAIVVAILGLIVE
jgi:hypothetical protein